MKYRKKPVVVEAFQLTGDPEMAPPKWLTQARMEMPGFCRLLIFIKWGIVHQQKIRYNDRGIDITVKGYEFVPKIRKRKDDEGEEISGGI